ncbi:MAG: hypothetical protein HYR51_17415 [Candidatus Rokubacteria bacterium]|nr:hypothetical protein [Candidatus Rokubacteria bacterium]
MPRHLSRSIPVLVALALTACAPLSCQPVSIVVAEKEERARVQDEVVGIRTTESGRTEEVRRIVRVPEFYLRGTDGRWYRVSKEVYGAAAPGQSLQVCR